MYLMLKKKPKLFLKVPKSIEYNVTSVSEVGEALVKPILTKALAEARYALLGDVAVISRIPFSMNNTSQYHFLRDVVSLCKLFPKKYRNNGHSVLLAQYSQIKPTIYLL